MLRCPFISFGFIIVGIMASSFSETDDTAEGNAEKKEEACRTVKHFALLNGIAGKRNRAFRKNSRLEEVFS